MAKHRVDFEIPKRELGNSNIEFRARRDETLLGTLRISKGAVVWTPAHNECSYKLDWQRLGALMERQGRRGRHT